MTRIGKTSIARARKHYFLGSNISKIKGDTFRIRMNSVTSHSIVRPHMIKLRRSFDVLNRRLCFIESLRSPPICSFKGLSESFTEGIILDSEICDFIGIQWFISQTNTVFFILFGSFLRFDHFMKEVTFSNLITMFAYEVGYNSQFMEGSLTCKSTRCMSTLQKDLYF